jgi:hypothetical protein
LLEEEAQFPEVSAETLGEPLEEEEQDFQVVADEPEPEFKDLACHSIGE